MTQYKSYHIISYHSSTSLFCPSLLSFLLLLFLLPLDTQILPQTEQPKNNPILEHRVPNHGNLSLRESELFASNILNKELNCSLEFDGRLSIYFLQGFAAGVVYLEAVGSEFVREGACQGSTEGSSERGEEEFYYKRLSNTFLVEFVPHSKVDRPVDARAQRGKEVLIFIETSKPLMPQHNLQSF